mgnify:CR=1 FL=1
MYEYAKLGMTTQLRWQLLCIVLMSGLLFVMQNYWKGDKLKLVFVNSFIYSEEVWVKTFCSPSTTCFIWKYAAQLPFMKESVQSQDLLSKAY